MVEPTGESPTLAELESDVRAVCMGGPGAEISGTDARRLHVYRDMVQRTQAGNIRQALNLSTAMVGAPVMDALCARFLDEVAPQTRLFWRIPVEFAAFVGDLAQTEPEAFVHPAFAELCAYEAAMLEVLLAEDRERHSDIVDRPHENLRAVFDPSLRLLVYAHPVHRLKVGATWPARTPTPSCIVAFRQHERFFWIDVHPHVAQVLALLGYGRTLGDAYAALDQALGAPCARPFINSHLSGLVRRGALLGFAASPPPVPTKETE